RQNSLVRTCGAAPPPNPAGAPATEVWVSVPGGGVDNQRFDCCDTDVEAFPGQTTPLLSTSTATATLRPVRRSGPVPRSEQPTAPPSSPRCRTAARLLYLEVRA